MNSHYVDGNGNRIEASDTGLFYDGLPLVVCRLVDNPKKGYLALDEGLGGFGDEDCPSSYEMPCLTWWGEGERYPTEAEAWNAFKGGSKTKGKSYEQLVELCQKSVRSLHWLLFNGYSTNSRKYRRGCKRHESQRRRLRIAYHAR